MTFLSIIMILAWAATIGGIAGQLFVTFKKTFGWAIWTTAAMLQIAVAIMTWNIPQLVLWIFFGAMDIYSWIKWYKEDLKERGKI